MNPIPLISLEPAMSLQLRRAGQSLAQRLRRLALSHRRRAAARRVQRDLQRLDARTLHDLGLHECEASSVGAEFAGLTERQRNRLAPMPRHLRGHV